jgi:hypothetical protein
MRRFVVLGINSSAVKKHEKRKKNAAIEGQDLEENVFKAFVDIFFYTGCVDLHV